MCFPNYSYRQKNDMCSGSRRRYSDAVPVYMRNRPKDMVQKCETRRLAGMEMADKVERTEGGIYRVQSESGLDPYTVTLDPSCTCLDYQQHSYPCKHVYAALFYEGKTFMQLPPKYTGSPWFCLDYHVMSLTPESSVADGDTISASHCSTNSANITPLESPMEASDGPAPTDFPLATLPKKAKVSLTVATECRELLRQLSSKTYLVADQSVLSSLVETLKQQLKYLNSKIDSSEDGLPYDPNRKRGGRYMAKRTKTDSSKLRPPISTLPKRSTSSKWAGRVGVSADRNRPVKIPGNTLTRARKILQKAMQLNLQSTSKSASIPVEEDIAVHNSNQVRHFYFGVIYRILVLGLKLDLN